MIKGPDGKTFPVEVAGQTQVIGVPSPLQLSQDETQNETEKRNNKRQKRQTPN